MTKENDNEKEYICIPEVAVMLGVSIGTVYNAIKNDNLLIPYSTVKVKGGQTKIIFLKSEVEQFVPNIPNPWRKKNKESKNEG